jgi:HD-GYP domain-containing protein (c-di-GMP phosphodiesterase class II)
MARIVAVADAFDAMTSNRPYRAGMPLDTALRHIQEGAGTQFDPALAEVFVNLRNKIGESLILRDPHLATVIPVSQPATLAIRQQATG